MIPLAATCPVIKMRRIVQNYCQNHGHDGKATKYRALDWSERKVAYNYLNGISADGSFRLQKLRCLRTLYFCYSTPKARTHSEDPGSQTGVACPAVSPAVKTFLQAGAFLGSAVKLAARKFHHRFGYAVKTSMPWCRAPAGPEAAAEWVGGAHFRPCFGMETGFWADGWSSSMEGAEQGHHCWVHCQETLQDEV